MQLVSNERILQILYKYNPWWSTNNVSSQFNKSIKRFAYYDANKVFLHSTIRRAILLSGARRTGKTTIMYQTIASLIENGIPSKNILFISFEHPLFKLTNIQSIIEAYKENVSKTEDLYFFFDEIQYAEDWNVWLKVLYDTEPNIRIMATGSTSPILNDKVSNESGLGRWTVITVPTLSFFEYCELLSIPRPNINPSVKPTEIHNMPKNEQYDIFNKISFLQQDFIRYLNVGGFPELALSDDDYYAQRILREDIVDKAIKRDLPALYGNRNAADIEKIFLYLCYSSSNIISIDVISKELGISRQTVNKYIDQLASANLIYISEPVEITGKKVLKIKNKIYISDAAIRNAVLMNDDITNIPEELGMLAETVVFKHVKSYYNDKPCKVGYYRESNNGKEIDIVVKGIKFSLMIEVKYREKSDIKKSDAIVQNFDGVNPNIVVTKRSDDFGIEYYGDKPIYRIPACAFVYLLGLNEYNNKNHGV